VVLEGQLQQALTISAMSFWVTPPSTLTEPRASPNSKVRPGARRSSLEPAGGEDHTTYNFRMKPTRLWAPFGRTRTLRRKSLVTIGWAYEWSNLLISCSVCNTSWKRTFFPLANPTQRARSHLEPPFLS
jgi:hypothetical protein